MRLVRDWRQTWRYYSTQAMVFAGSIHIAWASIPDDMRASVPSDWVSYATIATLILGVAGRLVSQADDA